MIVENKGNSATQKTATTLSYDKRRLPRQDSRIAR